MNRLLPLLGPLSLIILWHAVYMSGLVSRIILPGPLHVADAGMVLLGGGGLLNDLGLTLGRTLAATLISAMIGVPLGLFMGAFDRFYRALSFLIDFFRSIPPIALFPLFILIFGLDEATMIAVPVYGCALILTVSSIYGVRNTPAIRHDVAKVLGMSRVRTFFSIVLPSAIPQIVAGLRVAISLSLVLTIVVEMLMGTNDGLGRRIYQYHIAFDSPEMYFCIVLTGAVGYALNRLFLLAERSLLHWGSS